MQIYTTDKKEDQKQYCGNIPCNCSCFPSRLVDSLPFIKDTYILRCVLSKKSARQLMAYTPFFKRQNRRQRDFSRRNVIIRDIEGICTQCLWTRIDNMYLGKDRTKWKG